MAFVSRLKQGKHKLNLFSSEFKRFYVSNQALSVADQLSSSRTFTPVVNNSVFDLRSSHFWSFCNVRFYAAPIQFLQKQKEEEEKDAGPKLNEQITSPFIRLVTDEGHSVMPKHQALARARSLNMDLVEVDRNVKPPVCKIYDYKKEMILSRQREREHKKALKSKGVKPGAAKEVKFAAKIKEQDLKVKANMVRRHLESGHRVKCTAVEPTSEVDVKTLLSRFSAMIEDVALVEGAPRIDKGQAFVVVRHIKFGPSKKGSTKKLSEVLSSAPSSQSSETQQQNENDDTNSKIDSEELPYEEDDRNQVLDSEEEVGQAQPTTMAVQNRYARATNAHSARNQFTENEVKRAPSTPMAVQNRYARDTREHSTGNNRVNSAPQARPPPRRFEVPGNEVPKRESSPTKGFGIFNAQTPNGQNAPVVNRYMKNNPPDSTRSPRGPGFNSHDRER